MEMFRGDTFLKEIFSEDYEFKPNDQMHVAVLKSAYSDKFLYEKKIIIDKETNKVELEIPPKETSQFPTEKIILEIELTTKDGFVKTNQYELDVKADGINGQN